MNDLNGGKSTPDSQLPAEGDVAYDRVRDRRDGEPAADWAARTRADQPSDGELRLLAARFMRAVCLTWIRCDADAEAEAQAIIDHVPVTELAVCLAIFAGHYASLSESLMAEARPGDVGEFTRRVGGRPGWLIRDAIGSLASELLDGRPARPDSPSSDSPDPGSGNGEGK